MRYFQQLFDIEDRYRAADSALRLSARQEQSKPIVEEFHRWLEETRQTRLPKDKLLGD
ncbi:MAG: transposase [Pirellulales bacterium]